MSTLRTIAAISMGLFLCFITLGSQVSAQCVTCTDAPPGFICTAAARGGQGCMTSPGSCTTVGVCPQKGAGEENPGGGDTKNSAPCKPENLNHSQVKISDQLITEVGNVDARLAIALINIRAISVKFTEARVNLTSMQYTADDVANHLLQPADSPYFKEIARKASVLLSGGARPIVYDVTITEDKASASRILTVKPVDTSLALSSLALNLRATSFGKDKSILDGLEAFTWQIK